MTDNELIAAYQQGQVSRRTFIRRLAASGVSLGAALTYADLLWGDPAVAAGAADDFYCLPEPAGADHEILVTSSFTPVTLLAQLGACVRWRFHDQHSVRSALGFLASGIRPHHDPDVYGDFYTAPSDTYTRRFIASGTFQYFCDHPETVHPPMVGVVTVPMIREPRKDEVRERFTLAWAAVPAPAGYGYDVQIRRPGEKRWDDWKSNVDKPGTRFRPRQKGRYRFRARLRNDAGVASGWSPPVSVRAAPA